MIYCVVPPEMGEDVFRRLQERYRDNPNVTVIWERRKGERRAKAERRPATEGQADRSGHNDHRQLRDRRRRRLPGDSVVE